MGCEEHANGLTICRSPLERRVVGRTRSKKWCFKCRKRSVHSKVLHVEILRYTDKGELINGYYEPFLTIECPTCKEDHTSFNGD